MQKRTTEKTNDEKYVYCDDGRAHWYIERALFVISKRSGPDFTSTLVLFITPLPHSPKQDPNLKSRQNWPPLANMVLKITIQSNILKKPIPKAFV